MFGVGFIVRCISCGTDDPSVVYYVGNDQQPDTHCADCWIAALKKLTDTTLTFNMDGIKQKLDEIHSTTQSMSPPVQPLATVFNGTVDY